MKKFLKVIGILLLIVVIIIGSGAAFISIRGIPCYEPGKLEVNVEVTPERVARGKKIAVMICNFCHMDPKTGLLTGKWMDEAPPQFGKLFSQNITQSKEFGIGNWTDGELIYLLRTGIKKDGCYAPNWMLKVPFMSDEDVNSIVAFLRSDDPMVQAQEVPDTPTDPSFLSKFLSYVAFKPLPMPAAPIMNPDTTDPVAWGKYLALGVVDCYGCHSQDFKTYNSLEPEKTPGFFGGGNPLVDREGNLRPSANITPDEETGIGRWTQEQFITALQTGKKPDGTAIRYPMVPIPYLDSAECAAIYQYLRTVPPLKNKTGS